MVPLLLLPIWRRFGLLSVVIAAFVVGIAPFYLLNEFSMSASSWFLGLFALGMAAADIGFSQKPQLIAIRNSLRWDLLAIVFTVIGFLTEWKQLALDIWIGHIFCGLAAACLFIYCTKLTVENKKLPYYIKLFEHPWVVVLGAFSYSLYLTHGPVLEKSALLSFLSTYISIYCGYILFGRCGNVVTNCLLVLFSF